MVPAPPVPLSSTRVVISGDRPLIRTALARLIGSEDGFEVIGECANRAEALAAAMRAGPDVVVMDLDGGKPEIVAHARSCPVLVVTHNDDPMLLSAALVHGARGIVFESRTAEVLMRAIQAVVAGEAWLEPSMLANVFGPQRSDDEPRAELTRREREIVELVSLGLKNKAIGERLFISETTVRHHLTSIFHKLAVTSRLELMRIAFTGTIVPVARRAKLSLPPMRRRR